MTKTYSKLAAIYDSMYDDNFYQRYAAFIKKTIRKHKLTNVRLLDIACGTGRLIKELSGAVSVIEGIDNSAHMLEVARKRNPKVAFYSQDMTNFQTDKTYDVITCTFDSVNHLTALEQLKKFFCNVTDHLSDNGILIFDFNTIHKKPTGKIDKGNITLQDTVNGKYWDVIISSFKGDHETYQEKHRERLYSLTEIQSILTACHLHIQEIYSNFNKQVKAADKHEKLILVAQYAKR